MADKGAVVVVLVEPGQKFQVRHARNFDQFAVFEFELLHLVNVRVFVQFAQNMQQSGLLIFTIPQNSRNRKSLKYFKSSLIFSGSFLKSRYQLEAFETHA